jgi:uncharacterized protein YeaO (DUF488 family)
MSERIKSKIGEELYKQVIEKGIKPEEFDLLDGFVPRQRLNEESTSKKALEEKVKTYEQQITETQTLLKDVEGVKENYSKLQEKYKADLQAKDRDLANVIKVSAIKETLTKEGAKHTDLLMKSIDIDKLTMDGSNIVGLTDVVKGLKTNYADLFTQETPKGTLTKKPTNTQPEELGGIDWSEKFKNF